MRADVACHLALSEPERLQEEDPYTGAWTEIADTTIVGLHSRFEVDLNRPRDKAVYRKPEDAWGLQVWKDELPDDVAALSLFEYDSFYEETRRILQEVERRHGRFFLFDLHTYNHRREGPDGPEADAEANPEVNIGTGTVDRALWGPVVDRFLLELKRFDFGGRSLDVRENVKFKGGHLSRWTHESFPQTGCAVAIEFKKTFMDEWTGRLDAAHHGRILEALRSTVPGVLEELSRLPPLPKTAPAGPGVGAPPARRPGRPRRVRVS